MRFSLNFIKEFLDVEISPRELVSLLTMSGMEVERLEEIKGDWIYDIEVTTNRYDWLSILGITREIAAVLGKTFKVKYPSITKTPVFKQKNIIIEDKQDCLYYVGRIIKGVKVGVSLKTFKERIVNCGMNTVNNIVDITNYCMLKWGNPLHVFDYDKIEGDVYIRRAKEGESFIGIDEKTRILCKSNLVIADDKKVIALAGIMGAKNTEVDGSTKNVFLEGAIFSSLTVRRSRRSAGLDTESSYRFERMVSPFYLEYASYEAALLIKELAKGSLAGCGEAGKLPAVPEKKIIISIPHLNAYLGENFSKSKVKKTLKLLDCDVVEVMDDELSVSFPSCRFDIKREVDVYEEFVRIYGYDKIRPQIPFLTGYPVNDLFADRSQEIYCIKNEVRACVALFGFKEIITYSIEDYEGLANTGQKDIIRILNPLRKQENSLRTGLLLGMVKSIKHNLNHNQTSLCFFEVADIYSLKNKGAFSERPVLSLGVSGETKGFFYLKRIVEEFLRCMNADNFEFKEHHSGNFANSLEIFIGKQVVGFLGKLDIKRQIDFGLKEDMVFAQLDLLSLNKRRGLKRYKLFSTYPVVWRDLSVSLKKEIKFEEIEEIIKKESKYLKDLRIIDVYKGKDIPSGCSVFTLRIFYQSKEKTLTSQEVDSFHGTIREKLSHKEGVVLR